MLGWEFPPFISGGLGTACYGLTRALSRQDVEVLFVLPKPVADADGGHVHYIGPNEQSGPDAASASTSRRTREKVSTTYRLSEMPNVRFHTIDAHFPNAYQSPADEIPAEQITDVIRTNKPTPVRATLEVAAAEQQRRQAKKHASKSSKSATAGGADYSGNMFDEAQRYADLCVKLAREEDFDVIHAHDWMTYPAGLAVAGATGKPLVVHVHSTEFDRSGEHVNQPVYDIERRGMHGAIRVVCVSHLTRNICIHRYGVPDHRVDVVYNGIDSNASANMPRTNISRSDRIVLFLGRITMQKGPEFFVSAAQKVLAKVSNVKFVVAGSGDMARHMISMAAEMGIGHKVLFTGFLRGKDVERVFRMADVYVMPSVSEPFGIAPLEAIRHDVPVIISRNSGVAEVLQHALKVDFWDTDDIADKIIAVLRHPPLSQTMREHADLEVRQITWDGAAARCVSVYQNAIKTMDRATMPAE
ncbi:glycosyltransferase [Planctomycetales bacterium ZRK34]|nr:glycosyltransferase [Planctomycetales bacterium ZRK34]